MIESTTQKAMANFGFGLSFYDLQYFEVGTLFS